MRMVKNAISNTPLFLRVVCLYVVVTVPISVLNHISQPAAPVASVHIPTTEEVVKPIVKKEVISGHPTRISIPRLGINLPIVDGVYDKKTDSWTLDDYAVQYATMTALPNDQEGSTFLYGHNTIEVLEPVKNMVPGDVLKVTTKNGRVFSYTYVNDSSVTPDETNVLTNTSAKPRLVLMTCEGIFSETRRLLYFNFKGVV